MVPGTEFLLSGGQGGLSISPSSSANSGLRDSSINFGNSAPSATGKDAFLIGTFIFLAVVAYKVIK